MIIPLIIRLRQAGNSQNIPGFTTADEVAYQSLRFKVKKPNNIADL